MVARNWVPFLGNFILPFHLLLLKLPDVPHPNLPAEFLKYFVFHLQGEEDNNWRGLWVGADLYRLLSYLQGAFSTSIYLPHNLTAFWNKVQSIHTQLQPKLLCFIIVAQKLRMHPRTDSTLPVAGRKLVRVGECLVKKLALVPSKLLRNSRVISNIYTLHFNNEVNKAVYSKEVKMVPHFKGAHNLKQKKVPATGRNAMLG